MFEFGAFKLDEETVRLIKAEQVIDLEPQVFNTLLLLVKNRHRVVSKEELLDKIWQGRPVTDYVITRIIYELRKALDDGGDGDSHIRTVRGKGYQFVTPVVEVVQSSKVQAKPVSQNHWKNVALLATVVVLIWLFFSNWQTEDKTPEPMESPQVQITHYPRVVVLPITLDQVNDELSMLTQSLADYLTNELAISLNMKVIHPDSLLGLGEQQFNDLQRLQESTRSDFIIQGELDHVSDQRIGIHWTLYKNQAPNDLGVFPLGVFEFPFPQNTQALNDLYKQRKETVREIVKIITPGVEVGLNTESETDNPAVYRQVISAHHLGRTDDCAGLAQAEKMLLQAIEIDPDYAYAYHRLFVNYYKRVWYCGESKIWHAKALEMAEKVEELAPNRYHTLAIARHAILVESNQVETAYAFEVEAGQADPNAMNRVIYALRFAGFLNLAKTKMDQLLQVDPYFYSQKPVQQAPNTLMYLGMYDDYLSLLTSPGNAYHDYYRGMVFWLQGDISKAKTVLTSVVEKTPGDLFGAFSQAMLHVIDGELNLALEITQRISDRRDEKQHTDGEITYKQAQLFAVAGDRESALKYLRRAVEQGFFAVKYFKTDPMLRLIHGAPEFDDIINTATVRHLAFASRFQLEPESSP